MSHAAALDDPYAVCGSAISDALHILAAEFGLDGTVPDAATVAAGLRAMEPELAAALPVDTGDTDAAIVKAWSADEHPRSDDGRFIDAHDLHDATTDPAKAAELRKRVTKPEERKKLDEAIGAEKVAEPTPTPSPESAPVPISPDDNGFGDVKPASATGELAPITA